VEREVALLTAVRHPGIVLCFGATLAVGQRPMVVLERVEGGTLAEAIPRAEVTDAQRMDWLVQIGPGAGVSAFA
jgi:hypothetical protein